MTNLDDEDPITKIELIIENAHGDFEFRLAPPMII
jgi:hypothetical protein